MSPTDHSCFVAFLDAHKGILYKLAHAYCRERDDRSDLLQEMILQLWRAFGGYDEQQRFSTWMYRVALNVAISFYRKQWRRQRDLVPLDELGLDLGAADRALDDASDDLRSLQERLRTLGELDPGLVLLYLDGYAHDEIARIMGLTATNVSTRLSRIKQKLRQQGAA